MASEVQADNGVNVAALLAAREALTEHPRVPISNGERLVLGRTERTAIRPSRAFTASARSKSTRPFSTSTQIIPSSLPLRTRAPHRLRWCLSA